MATTAAATALLQGHSALVTGAAFGIGRQTALALVRHGVDRLALADCDAAALDAFADELRRDWPAVEVLPLAMDVRKPAEVSEGIARAGARFGRLDIAVNNAGVAGADVRTHETDEDEWQRVVDIDLNGVFRCMKAELALMQPQDDLGPRRGRGSIINVASMYGTVGPPSPSFLTSYTAAKHGVVGLTRADANAYGECHVRINAICPGFTATRITGELKTERQKAALEAHIERTPMARMAMPEEIADSIVFLASPMSSFMHGAALVVDGGFTSC